MSMNRALLAAPLALLVMLLYLSSCGDREGTGANLSANDPGPTAESETNLSGTDRAPTLEPDANLSVLNRAVTADPESLDPQKGRSIQSADVLRDIGEGLLGYSASGELIPASAERWSISDDGLVYTLTLREGLKWSNGEAVTAEHFVNAFRRLVDPATAAFYAGQVNVIENADAIIAGKEEPSKLGVSAPDERTVEIRLVQPTPYMLYLLTHPSTFPVNPTALQQHGEDFIKPGNLVSNGPYVLEARQPGAVVTLRRNEHFWNAANVDIDIVRHHVVKQEMTELNRFRAGELDMTSNVPPEAFETVKEEFPDELRISPALGVYYYGFNLTKPPFKDNPKLRQALSMAVDRELIVERITARGELPAWSWVPPGVDNYTPPQLTYSKLSQDERNAIAKSLYNQAGYDETNPAKIELRYNTSDTHRRIALAVQAMWAEVLGVETTLINEEFQVLITNMREREVTQVFRSSWSGDYTDAVTFLGIMVPGETWNLPGYDNAEYGELMEAAARQTDLQRRRLYLEEAERVLLADHAVLPLYFFVSDQLVSQRVRGWQDNPLNYHYSQYLSLVDTEE